MTLHVLTYLEVDASYIVECLSHLLSVFQFLEYLSHVVVVQKSLVVITNVCRNSCHFYGLGQVAESIIEHIDLFVFLFVAMHDVVMIPFLG